MMKNKKLVGGAAGKFHKKVCGKRHAYCNICKPNRDISTFKEIGFAIPEVREKARQTAIKNGSFAGKNNPNYKGGQCVNVFRTGWKAIRRLVWKRDKVCQLCGKKPMFRKLDVHHIISRRNGGKDMLSNLIGLCHSCHVKVEYNKISLEECAEW